MKKRIVTLVALLMILCLALAGCGQRGSNTNDSSNHATGQNEENTTVNNTDVETEEPTETETETETETNPSNSDSGIYTYELHGGITISCKTNVWDYIDGNSFDFRAMAHDLGFIDDLNDMPECHGFSAEFSGQTVVIGFSEDENPNLSNPYFEFVVITAYGGGVRELAVRYYFDDANFYTINGSGPKLSFDAIPIVAYALENFSSDNKDPYKTIFEPYRAPKDIQQASWKEYHLP